MSGSRSNYSSYSGKPSFDQLSRTIEGLEARIQGLVSDRRPPQQRPAYAENATVDEILERQRMLSSVRERVAAADRTLRGDADRPLRGESERPRRSERLDYEPRREAPRADYAQEQAAYRPQQNDALQDIAATLEALRAELKQGLNNSSVDEIRDEIRGLKGLAANGSGASDIVRKEIQRLNDSVRRLSDNAQQPRLDELMSEIEDLRAVASGLAREDSVRQLDERWSKAEKIWDTTARKLDILDQDALREELVQIAWRIDGIKSGLGEMNAAPAVRALEDKLITLANAIESVGRSVDAKTDFTTHFEGMDRRLDEISRAIATSLRQAGNSQDQAALLKIEQRIGELTLHIDALNRQNGDGDIAQRLELLTQRIEDLAGDAESDKIEQRISQLAAMIERSLGESRGPDLSGPLADIARKIDGLGDQNSDALIDRLDMLARRLDDLDRPIEVAAPVIDLPDFTRIETRLTDIAARLEETAATPASDNYALQNLEQQIASLSALLTQPSQGQQSGPEELTRSISVIEDYIASSDEFIVEAARQAAEAVIEAYSRQGVGSQSPSSADLSALTALAEDLRALESYARSSEERTSETFSALHQTLTQIARRLDDLGEASNRQRMEDMRRAEAEAQQAALARTVQPQEPQQLAAPIARPQPQPEPVRDAPRAAPRNSTVDVYEDEALLTPADLMDEDDKIDMADEQEPLQAAQGPRSLIAGLAARFMPAKKSAEARLTIAPDASAPEDRVESSVLIEPGGQVPDVKKIMEKVRAGQKSGRPAEVGQTDMIAAARRAAQAAANEAGMQTPLRGKAATKPATGKQAAAASQSRRPLLLAAGAVLLVLMSYPLVSNLIKGHSAPDQAVTDVTPEKTSSLTVDAPQQMAMAEPEQTAKPETATPLEPLDAQAQAPVAQPNEPAAEAPAPQMAEASPAAEPSDAISMDASTEPSEPVDAMPELKTDAAPDQGTPAAEPAAPVAAAPAVDVPAEIKPASLVAAAKAADPMAYFEIASRYADGRTVKQDTAAAIKWYQMAADAGFAPAEYRLASIYEKGLGAPRDIAKARALYTSAAGQGNVTAMHNLAVISATGAAGKPDFQEAARWFKEAAERNVRDSQYNLAILYARGNGVQQDLTESYKWFAAAARQGDQDAARKRDEVANALPAEQLKSAKAKADLWQPMPVNEDANTPTPPDAWAATGNTTATVDMKRAIRNIQAILNNNGFDAGPADGAIGKKTVEAIKAFQKSVGQEPTGKIDEALVKELLKRNKRA